MAVNYGFVTAYDQIEAAKKHNKTHLDLTGIMFNGGVPFTYTLKNFPAMTLGKLCVYISTRIKKHGQSPLFNYEDKSLMKTRISSLILNAF